MTKFFKNNPEALRLCVLYEFLQKKSVDEAFTDFCETVGNDIIKKGEFQHWFAQFERGKIGDEKKPVADLKEFIRNDKHALRVCVMYEWLVMRRELVEMPKIWCFKNKALPIFDKYKRFSYVIGRNVMKYREFEFWFYRFFNGEFDLNYERDKDQKIYELTDMPIDIMRNIVKYLNIFDRVLLARTSRAFKTFVEDQKLFFKKLEYGMNKISAYIYFETNAIAFEKKKNGCFRISTENSQRSGPIRGVCYWKQGLKEFGSILKFPKLHLEHLSFKTDLPHRCEKPNEIDFEFSEEIIDALEAALKPIEQLYVKKLSCNTYTLEPVLKILPFLKPGYLTTINVHVSKPDVNMMEMILFKSPDFETCSLNFLEFVNPITIIQEFGGIPIEESIGEKCHYPIPNSNDYFEISVGHRSMSITRKKK